MRATIFKGTGNFFNLKSGGSAFSVSNLGLATYLGDLQAFAQAFVQPNLDTPGLRKRFLDPDGWQKPSIEVDRLVTDFGKVSGARAMSAHLRGSDQNLSTSYKVFVAGVQKVATEMGFVQAS